MRVHFLMHAMIPAVILFPEDALCDRLLPMMFSYPLQSSSCFGINSKYFMQCKILSLVLRLLAHPDIRLNKKSHEIFKSLFLGIIVDGRREMPTHVTRIVPYYLRLSLDHYGSVLPFEAFADSIHAIVSVLPPTAPLLVFCFKALADKIHFLHTAKGQPIQPDARGAQSFGFDSIPRSVPSSKHLIVLLFSFITTADLQVLDIVLMIVSSVIKASEHKVARSLCRQVYGIISTNYDYTRKDECIKWYLNLLHDLHLSTENHQIQKHSLSSARDHHHHHHSDATSV